MPQLILIGSRGAGKTSVGVDLAARLGRTFADLDDRAISLVGGGGVRAFIARAGEPAWRELERRAFLEATVGPVRPAILALGGGAVTVAMIREELARLRARDAVRVAWLTASIATLSGRLDADPGDRGSLTGLGLAEELPTLLAAREPFYRSLSDRTVATDGRSIAAIADDLAAWLVSVETVS